MFNNRHDRNDRDHRRRIDTYLLVSVLFAGSLALGDYGIRFYISVLNVTAPHHVVAGFTEPLTTKLIPAIGVVWIHQWQNISTTYIRSHPFWFAFVGGISLGITERVLYIVVKGAAVSPGFLLAPWMHALNSVLIAGLIFSAADNLQDYRLFPKLLAATIAAVFIHVLWNVRGVLFIHQLFS